jgi:hypothetical protein
VQGNLHSREDFMPELAQENHVSISSDYCRRAMQLDDIVDEQVSYFLDSVRV